MFRGKRVNHSFHHFLQTSPFILIEIWWQVNSGIFPKLLYDEDAEGCHRSAYFNRRLFCSPVGLGESAERQESTEAHLGDGHWWQLLLGAPYTTWTLVMAGATVETLAVLFNRSSRWFFFFFFNIYLFWPYQVLVVALRIFNLVFVATCHQNTRTLSYSTWALVPCRDQTQGP